MSEAWLIIPTYKEADNLRAIVEAALPQLAQGSPTYRVVIVDDNSPDGTGDIADELADEHAQVEVLHRPGKAGLGRAYVAGFRRALAGGAELILEMDADFSHDPRDLPRLIEASSDADLVLGSRYVEHGRVEGWRRRRRFVSRGGCRYARLVLDVPIHDLTGGFKCFRREVLEALDLESVDAAGYGFQIEMTFRAIKAGFRVSEVPIVFRDRTLGKSKMTLGIAAEAMLKVPALRWRFRGRP